MKIFLSFLSKLKVITYLYFINVISFANTINIIMIHTTKNGHKCCISNRYLSTAFKDIKKSVILNVVVLSISLVEYSTQGQNIPSFCIHSRYS